MIPDEALKIAGDVFTEVLVDLRLREGGGFKVASQQRRAIAAALAAAAPYLMRAAWDEGKSAGWDAARGEPEESNPYEEESE